MCRMNYYPLNHVCMWKDVAAASEVETRLSDLGFAKNALSQQGMDFKRCVWWDACGPTYTNMHLRASNQRPP